MGANIAKIVTLLMLIMILLVGGLMYKVYVDGQMNSVKQTISRIANAASNGVDGDQIENYAKTLKEDGGYMKVFNYLSDIKTSGSEQHVYIIASHSDTEYVFLAEGAVNRDRATITSWLGDIDKKENFPGAADAISSATTIISEPYMYNGDELITVFAPIKNSAGKVVALLGMDSNVKLFLKEVNEHMVKNFMVIGIIVTVVFLIMFVAASAIIRKRITVPVQELKKAAEDIAAGNIDIEIHANSNNELGDLADSFRNMVEVLRSMEETVQQVKTWAINGEHRRGTDRNELLNGSYLNIVRGLNHVMKAFSARLDSVPLPLTIVDTEYNTLFMNKAALRISELNQEQVLGRKCYECLNTSVCNTEDCPAKRALKEDRMVDVQLTIGESEYQTYIAPFADENDKVIGFIEMSADQTDVRNAQYEAERQAQQVAHRIKVAEKQADYQKDCVDHVIFSLERLSRGDLSYTSSIKNKDEDTKDIFDSFLKISYSLETSCRNIKGYIDELSDVLRRVADKNLDVMIDQDYKGDFSELKNSINNILRTLNRVFGEISGATGQVQTAATQVANSSQILAEGASEQSNSVSEINTTIIKVADETRNNAENAVHANGISVKAMDDAEDGSAQMHEMISAMEEIKRSSHKIAEIIKVIDEIAFQTNVLALNAAVEADRAGEHGRGFAVVADEVRNLAAKSAEAAKETTDMIADSLLKVEAGVSIANKTSGALSKIVEGVTSTADIVRTIADASKRQAAGIVLIENSIEKISKVTKSNVEEADQTASASHQMSEQSQVLREMIKEFRLRDVKDLRERRPTRKRKNRKAIPTEEKLLLNQPDNE